MHDVNGVRFDDTPIITTESRESASSPTRRRVLVVIAILGIVATVVLFAVNSRLNDTLPPSPAEIYGT